MKGVPIEDQDQAKTVPEVHSFHPTVRLKVLEDDKTRPEQTRIFRTETITNQHLLTRCNQDSIGTIIMQRRLRWIGHEMRREPGNISRTALHWTPEGKQKQG